ncbi:Phosphoesterase, PA-phosphatase related protein [Labilithrix luteola]|uniref:Phosphoesterase, PA-phosphatase related protein n=1 Tax=Labilithrix luteola TaxID=1391654 RepID=A0A0K1PQZ2_9BACT|nr:phosphatase PAP2 family protein [Labilithrix luteola]AKU95791.1 Phosphoesterase, PA-phosphatase related protein [Labilithrix luteola]
MNDFDAHIFRVLNTAMSGHAVLLVMTILSVIGSGWSMIAIAPLFAAARTRRFAAFLVTVLSSTALAVFIGKQIVGRTRPYIALGIQAHVASAPTDFSFPSGHAAGSFAFATFVGLVLLRGGRAPVDVTTGKTRVYRMLGAAALFATATGVALSRVALGVHFPGDIAAGALLGMLLGATGATYYLRQPGATPVTD